MKPSYDPNCQKYIDDPDKVFYSGRWRTPEQIEKYREKRREAYENLSGVEYNKMLLRKRRNKVLQRKARRKATNQRSDS